MWHFWIIASRCEFSFPTARSYPAGTLVKPLGSLLVSTAFVWTGSRESDEPQVLRIEGGSALRVGDPPADGGLGPCSFGKELCICIMSIYDIIIHYICDMLLPMLPRPDSKVWDGFFLLRCKSHCKWNCVAEFAGVDCKLALATARAGHAWNTSLHYQVRVKKRF